MLLFVSFALLSSAGAWPRLYGEEIDTTFFSSSSSLPIDPSASTTSIPSTSISEEISSTTSTSSVLSSTSTKRITDYFEEKVNELAGVSCDVCLKAVYGINYNVIRLKKAAEDMVKQDCEALFHGNGEYISRCIRVMVEKIEHYYDKVEPMIDTRNLCVKMRMCAPQKKSD